MLTTKPVPQKGRLKQALCSMFIGHLYSINQVLTAEENQGYPWQHHHRFCERCGHKEFMGVTSWGYCDVYACKECPRQKLCNHVGKEYKGRRRDDV